MSSRAPFVIALVVAAGGLVGAGYLGWQAYRSEHPGEVDLQTAWIAVRLQPRHPERWAVLGDAQATVDQTLAAEKSYRTAIRLGTTDATVYGRLGFFLYGQGRDHEALDFLSEAQRRGADLPLLASTIHKLKTHPAELVADEPIPETPPEAEPLTTRPCRIALERRGVFIVPVLVEGVESKLIMDTGASLTVLSRELLEELDVDIDHEHTIHAITATGPTEFPTAKVGVLVLGGRPVRDLTVAVCEGCGGRSAHGLLGLDVQAALGVELDLAHSELGFRDCATAEE